LPAVPWSNRGMADIRNPLFARIYTSVSPGMEKKGVADHRKEMLAGVTGRVVEVGAGNGLNFQHYPGSVTEVIAVEPEPYLRAAAEAASRSARVPVDVIEGTAESLPLEDAAFDVGVASLVLCSVRDQFATLGEFFRVIKPGGELRFYEHIAADQPGLARLQRLVDATVWPLVSGNCHTHRHTVGEIEKAGFVIEDEHRFSFKPCLLGAPAAPHVIGRARRP